MKYTNVNTRKNMAYNDLPLSERAQIIHMGVQAGLKSLGDIRSFYDNAVNEYAEGGGIYISPSKRGTFTAAATKHDKSVQAFASQVLAHKENYSPSMVRKANFARNAAHWHDGDSDTQYLNTEVYEPWFPDKHKEDYGFNIGQWIGPMHVREMQLGNAKNHSEASSYLVDSNKEFINDYVSRLSAAHPELSRAALSNIRTALSPESISFVSDNAFAKSNTAGETTARREGNRIIPEIRLRDNIGYYDTQNKSRDLSNIFRHELHHFLRKYQGNYTNPIFNPEERETLNSAYFAVPSTLERGAENARLRSIIAQNNGNVWGKDLDNVIDNLSYEDLLSYISNMEGYMKDSESLYTAPNKEAVSNLQSKIAEKDKERETILNTVIYPKYLIPYEDGMYIKDNIINQYKTREGEEASVVRDAMFKEWDENKDLKRIAYERKALEEELKKALMVPNKERLDAVKRALKQVAQNNSSFQKLDNAYLAALGGNLKSWKHTNGGPNIGGYSDRQIALNKQAAKQYDPTLGFDPISWGIYLFDPYNHAKGEENLFWNTYLGLVELPKAKSSAMWPGDPAIEKNKQLRGEEPSDFYSTTPRMDQMIQARLDTAGLKRVIDNYDDIQKKGLYKGIADKETLLSLYNEAKNVLNNPDSIFYLHGEDGVRLNPEQYQVMESFPLGMLGDFGVMWDRNHNQIKVEDAYNFPGWVRFFSGNPGIPKRPREMKIRANISLDPNKGSYLLRSDENWNNLAPIMTVENTKSTGGPLYPFSFSKVPLPRVRY